jgi:2-amino-4-hydroxy-6-hydroxymethyldihydropteridine diphosphokinase
MRIFLSLGSNLGDRVANLRAGIDALKQLNGVCVTTISPWYETEPIGEADQPVFLNLVIEIETELEPLELIEPLKGIERDMGRVPSGPWAPRPIDMDIILCGDLVMDTDRISVPHKEFRRRRFVLAPLADIAPDAIDPVTGKTIAELANGSDVEGDATLFEVGDY